MHELCFEPATFNTSVEYANVGHFFTTSDQTLEMDIGSFRNEVKRPRLIDLGRSLGCPTVCLPETK